MNIKQVLNDYVDACELVRETEDDIAELEQKQSVVTSDKVKGSMNEHPYIIKEEDRLYMKIKIL